MSCRNDATSASHATQLTRRGRSPVPVTAQPCTKLVKPGVALDQHSSASRDQPGSQNRIGELRRQHRAYDHVPLVLVPSWAQRQCASQPLGLSWRRGGGGAGAFGRVEGLAGLERRLSCWVSGALPGHGSALKLLRERASSVNSAIRSPLDTRVGRDGGELSSVGTDHLLDAISQVSTVSPQRSAPPSATATCCAADAPPDVLGSADRFRWLRIGGQPLHRDVAATARDLAELGDHRHVEHGESTVAGQRIHQPCLVEVGPGAHSCGDRPDALIRPAIRSVTLMAYSQVDKSLDDMGRRGRSGSCV